MHEHRTPVTRLIR